MTEKRVKVSKTELDKVVNTLRSRGYSNKDISKQISARIDRYLYYDNCMSIDSFRQLENLYGDEIKHNIIQISQNKSSLKYHVEELTEDCELAELFGIILGDGHLQSNNQNGSYYLEITLSTQDGSQINNAMYLIRANTGLKPKIYNKSGRAVRVVAHSKDLVKKLEKLGLESGNKKQNQVGAPAWIKKDREYSKYCLKGLIDTDGSIYQDNRPRKSYIRIQFSNHSSELLKDFQQMCQDIGLKNVKGGKQQLQISRKSVDKFLNEISPIKSNGLKLLE